MMFDMMTPVRDFPLAGVLPKEETQAAPFLRENPQFDGREVLLAILDTGVDPGAIGLQKTSTGLPKIVDIIDCTGQGDVDCSTVVEPTVTTDDAGNVVSRTLKGLTGRTLHVPSTWKLPPDNKYHLGWKAVSTLYPKEIIQTMKDERKEMFDLRHHALVTKLQETLSELNGKKDVDSQIADIKAQLDALKEQMAAYQEPGLIVDCVVFNDGEKWRAAIDINESGDLKDAPLLTSYHDERQYASFGSDSLLNFSVNIYDNGDMLSIVSMSGSHGTHVAAIAAANHPMDPLQNGVAPGAQIVSLKIGDGRVNGMETGTGLVRAAIEIVRLKCDVANMSFGEPYRKDDYGRFSDLLRDEVINKSGCIFLSSAGNSGPALSTVGMPGAPVPGALSIGAYTTAAMYDAMYSLLEKAPEARMTFTSHGPTLDGAVGVDVYAPGAAITSVPQYTRNGGQFMNGTSMASPNAAGCVTLLVSALKQENIPFTPYRVAAAIRNTSKDFSDPFKVGLIQVSNAFAHLKSIRPLRHNLDVLYEIKVASQDNGRGIYLREVADTITKQNFAVNVKPKFFRNKVVEQHPKKIEFEAHIALVCTASWISAPEFLMLFPDGKDTVVQVDPTKLSPGLHFGEVLGIDTNQRDAGPLFRIPITVCKAEDSHVVASDGAVAPFTNSIYRFGDLMLQPDTVFRRFVDVPLGANFAEIILRSKDRVGSSVVCLDLNQIMPNTSYKSNVESNWVRVSSTGSGVPGDDFRWSKFIAVKPGVMMELAFAHYWTHYKPSDITFEIIFHGLFLSAAAGVGYGTGKNAGGDLIYLNSGNTGFARCDLFAPLRREEISVSVTLDSLRKSIRPTDALISPLRSRDTLPDSRQLHQGVLTYTLKVPEGVTSVTPHITRVTGVLYDSYFENFALQVFDSQKALKATQDVYPKSLKLSEGTYTVRVQFVSRDIDTLDKLQNIPLLVDFALAKSVSLPVYGSMDDVQTSSSGNFSKKFLLRGQRVTFFVGGCEGSNLPKTASSGDLMIGKFKVAGGDASKLNLHNAAYIVPSEFKAKETPTVPSTPDIAAPPEAPKDEAVQLEEAVRDLEISHLKKMKDGEKQAVLISRLEKQHATHLPFLVAKLEVAGEKLDKAMKVASVPPASAAPIIADVTAAVDAVMALIDTKELAIYFGLKIDAAAGGEAAKNKKKENDARKSAVVLALGWRAKALRQRIIEADAGIVTTVTTTDVTTSAAGDATAQNGGPAEDLMAKFDATLIELSQWLPSPPTSDGKYLTLWVWRLKRKGLRGQALCAINKFIGDAKNMEGDGAPVWKELVEMKRALLDELGWEVWRQYEDRWRILRSPPTGFAPF